MKKYPLCILLLVSTIILTVIGTAGKNNVYKHYKYDGKTTPVLALALEGLHKGVTPIDVYTHYANAQAENDVAENTQDADMTDETAGELETEEMLTEEMAEDSLNKEEAKKTYEFTAVTEDYFDDALFIGDSRTVGLWEYGGIEERADFYAQTSLTIYNILTKPFIELEGEEEKLTVEQALTKKQFGKIYLMVGINELGTGDVDYFMDEYRKVIGRIRQLQPDAVLFIEGIMRVADKKDKEDAIFNNTNINARNEAIAKLANNETIFYIDVNDVVCDENGALIETYTTDSVHLKAAYYKIWKQFLMENGIEK